MTIESFAAGFCYGATTVVVGQPLDTIKTIQQASTTSTTSKNNNKSMFQISRKLYGTGGMRAFYRGGIPLLLGGGFIRSAQFGVYSASLQRIVQIQGYRCHAPEQRYLGGTVDPQVVLAGFMGGIGRGLVEGPFEMVKVRQQVQTRWSFREILKGSGTTLLRNSVLFSTFVVYMDISKLYVHLSPFWLGGICANLAWLTIWPLDVVKSRVQSGGYEGQSVAAVLRDAARSGHSYKGLVPGLTRSFIANGSSMVVYKFVEQKLTELRQGRDS